MGAFLLVTLIAGGIFFLGYRIGSRFVRDENISLRRQLTLLQQHSTHWAQEASQKYQLSSQIAQQQTTNVTTTMQTVIQLLSTIQREQAHTLSSQEQHKVSQIINQVKSIADH